MAKPKTEKGAAEGGAKKGKAAPAAAPPAPASARAIPPPTASSSHSARTEAVHKRHGFRRTLVGRVTSDKMNKTVTVEVIRNAQHATYNKFIRFRERYKAHDETNQYKVGDRVEIQEHRPISRDKRWLVTKLIRRPVQE